MYGKYIKNIRVYLFMFSRVCFYEWYRKIKDSKLSGLVENGKVSEIILCSSDFLTEDLKISFRVLHIYRHHVCHKQQHFFSTDCNVSNRYIIYRVAHEMSYH